jgi:hypothetical protein
VPPELHQPAAVMLGDVPLRRPVGCCGMGWGGAAARPACASAACAHAASGSRRPIKASAPRN